MYPHLTPIAERVLRRALCVHPELAARELALHAVADLGITPPTTTEALHVIGRPMLGAAVAELVNKGMLDDERRLTSLGARKLLDLLVRDELAAPCRCGHTREHHTADSPHGCVGYVDETPEQTHRRLAGIFTRGLATFERGGRMVTACTCRSFTPSSPVYRTPPAPAPDAALAMPQCGKCGAALPMNWDPVRDPHRCPEKTEPPSPAPATEPAPPRDLARLLRRFAVGQHVSAALDIVDAASGTEIAKGTIGMIVALDVAGCGPLVSVRWSESSTFKDEPMTVTAESIDPLPVATAIGRAAYEATAATLRQNGFSPEVGAAIRTIYTHGAVEAAVVQSVERINSGRGASLQAITTDLKPRFSYSEVLSAIDQLLARRFLEHVTRAERRSMSTNPVYRVRVDSEPRRVVAGAITCLCGHPVKDHKLVGSEAQGREVVTCSACSCADNLTLEQYGRAIGGDA